MNRNHSRRRLVRLFVLSGVIFLAGGFADRMSVHGWQEPGLPAGDGVEIARSSCLSCHGTNLITEQRLTREKWLGEVNKMINWGAVVEPADKAKLVDYLATHFLL